MPATKDQIADAFERQVGRFGYARAAVEDVSAELGISKRTIYQHFSSKKDLYAFIIDRLAMQSRSELRQAVAGPETWGEKLEALTRVVLAGARQHIVETSRAEWEQEYEIAGDAFMKAVGDVTGEIIGGGIEAGEFAFPDAAIAERLASALVLEYVLLVRADPDLDIDEDLASAVRRFLG